MERETQKVVSKFYRKAQQEKTFFGGQGAFELRFQQIQDSLITKGLFSKIFAGIQWKTKYQNLSWPTDPDELQKQLPINQNPDFKNISGHIKYTWIGHSTAVIAIDQDINFLIDPVFSDRASFSQMVGPLRFRKPACKIENLPKIDAVFVSHDHYDHLDETSLNELFKKDQPLFFAGLRSKDVFPQKSTLYQMDWTETIEVQIKNKKFKITFVPVCHWGRRGMNDQNHRLWGGFIIETQKKKKIFYSGDTGYCGIFKQLGDIFGGFDLSILPIGAYLPRPLLKSQHVDPQEAVIIHKQIKSKKSVGVHWGTFPLGNQHYTAARKDLQIAKDKHRLAAQQFITVQHGGSFSIDH